MRYLNALLIILVISSCGTMEEENQGEFRLLPAPKSMSISGASNLTFEDVSPEFESLRKQYIEGNKTSKGTTLIELHIDPSMELNEEGYTLDITDTKIYIAAAHHKGIWSGLMTLSQLLEDAKDQSVSLPKIEITDYPLLGYRAIHIDVKHHMETEEYYYELIDRLSSYKINGIIIEIEDKLAFEKQPIVGAPDARSITVWKALSDYAIARNVEISPLVQGLGHASFILKHDEYLDLRDDPESDWAFNPLDDRTYKVQFDLYDDALKAFPHGRFLHVGGDEVHTTGRGSGKTSLELQLGWLARVSGYADEHDRVPIFWDDMPLKFANVMSPIYDMDMTKETVDSIWQVNEPVLNGFIDQFPKNCVYMRWNYSAPGTYGNAKAMEWFTDNGFQVMGATAGQTRWKLMPQNESNFDNIREFALASIDKKAEGLLLTLWDDDSPHFELYGRGIAAFAESTWSGNQVDKPQFKQSYRHRTFGPLLADEAYAFIDRMEKPAAFWNNALLKSRDRNRLRDLDDPAMEAVIDLPAGDGVWAEVQETRIKQAAEALDQLDGVLTTIQTAKESAVRNKYTLEVYEQAANVARFAPHVLVTLAEYDKAGPDELNIKRENVLKLSEEFIEIESEVLRVYGKTRVLNKPSQYILDQDHHVHLANQALKYEDWQFFVEKQFIEKLNRMK